MVSFSWRACLRISASAVFFVTSYTVSTETAQTGGGTTIATATLVEPAATQFGDTQSSSMAPGKSSPIAASCPSSSSPSREQVWKVDLSAGDRVTVTGGYSSPVMNMEIAFWPAGTTDADLTEGRIPPRDFSGNTIAGYAGGRLESGQSLKFTVPTTGAYPFVIGNCDGTTGPYHFHMRIRPGHTNGRTGQARRGLRITHLVLLHV
jgi:hypothetical protein